MHIITKLLTPATQSIFSALEDNARFVGGCVRNALLDTDITDIDIATPHKPEVVIALLKKQGIRSVPTGIKHGTITAIVRKRGYEITTLRRDVACDGRHAEVEFTDDWQEDAARRDFTMNAMSTDVFGKLYDYFDGQEDLKRGLVRFVGNAENRCREDVLRILRFFRFNAWYGNAPLDAEGLAACALLADQLPSLSGERIQMEMLKLLAAPNPYHALEAMDKAGIATRIFGIAICLLPLTKLVRLESENYTQIVPLLRLATLLPDVTAEQLEQLGLHWKLSKKDAARLGSMCLSGDLSPLTPIAEQHCLIRRYGKDSFQHRFLRGWAQTPDTDDESYSATLTDARRWKMPFFHVSGKDLAALGIPPGPPMGQLLKTAEAWWEDGGYVATHEETLAFVREQWAATSPKD